MQALGDRIKNNYENRNKKYLTRNIPVILRCDGAAFHTFTRGFNKPFDKTLMDKMVSTVIQVSERIQGFKCAYTQSDEISILLTDYDSIETNAWFDYSQSKIESVTAGMISAYFNLNDTFKNVTRVVPYFDCRAFNIPKEEVVNYFVWRAKDWERNSLQMYCSANFSHKQLHGKNKFQQHELLHSIGKNWTKDLTNQERNGTFIFRDGQTKFDVLPTYESINSVLKDLIYISR
jgi:tRNA(His) guanylyltransferase